MFGKPKGEPGNRQALGDDLARVLPQDGVPWYKKKHLVILNYYAVSLALFSAANGYDGSMMNGLQALPQWFEFMDDPAGSWLGFINAVQWLSAAIGYPCVAYFANRWGRKKGLFVGYVFLFLGAFLQAFGPSKVTFVLGRLFLGQPSAWWGGLAPLIVTELAFPTHRGFLTALCMCGWYVGSTLAAWVTYGTRNIDDSWAWRIPSILQIAIPVVILPAAFLVPESPRFLISKGRLEKAREILTTYHAGGDRDSLLVDFEMTEIARAIEADKAAMSSTSWLDLISTKGNRHRAFISVTLGIFAQWNGVGVVSYYLAMVLETVGITSVTNQTLISGCLQIWNLIWSVASAASVDLIGRRPLFLVSAGGMLTCFVLITGLSGGFATTASASVGIAVVPFLYLYYGFYDIAFTPLLMSYTAEIWPYELRARGMALLQMSTSFAVFFNIFVNPIALGAIGWKYYIVFVVVLFLVIITIYFFYPETRGHSLEEMAVIFDGDAAAVTGLDIEADVKGDHVNHEESV